MLNSVSLCKKTELVMLLPCINNQRCVLRFYKKSRQNSPKFLADPQSTQKSHPPYHINQSSRLCHCVVESLQCVPLPCNVSNFYDYIYLFLNNYFFLPQGLFLIKLYHFWHWQTSGSSKAAEFRAQHHSASNQRG